MPVAQDSPVPIAGRIEETDARAQRANPVGAGGLDLHAAGDGFIEAAGNSEKSFDRWRAYQREESFLVLVFNGVTFPVLRARRACSRVAVGIDQDDEAFLAGLSLEPGGVKAAIGAEK